ncbi:MAG TPA: RagB/SusD family nutrient uptake outer membrane protein [Bacteroidales bacterium]|nr:RagB/SusD family nutrient uptake outer membrane protein [Bacteroidales bacterium]
MKKYFLILSLFIGLVFSSCSDFLTVDTLSSFDADYVFTTEDDALKVLLSAYACFPTDAFTSRMSSVFMQNTDVEATGVSAARDGSRRDVWSLEPQQSFSDMKNCWNMCYLAIDRANQCIEGITKSTLYKDGNANMKQMLGEAYCMRAYWYYLLINFYGDVPSALQASRADMKLDNPRSDKNAIYTELIKSLVEHEADMKWASDLSGGIERMNREFALGMIARLSLFRAGYSMQYDGTMKRADDYLEYYQKAKDACAELIALKDRPLNPSFQQVFLNECRNLTPVDDDVLYEVAFVQGGGGDVGWCVGVTVSGGIYGSGSSYVGFPATYYYSFDEKDTRFPVTCAQYKINDVTGSTVFMDPLGFGATTPGKWCRAWTPNPLGSTSTKGTGINWPIMRYSDVLLMLAEADNELNGGPTDAAIAALKRVRNRAFDAADRADKVEHYVDSVAAGGHDAFFNALVDERSWEFGGECLRRFDLVRWNLYGQKIVDVKQGLICMGLASRNILPGSAILDSAYTDENGTKGKPEFYTMDKYNKYSRYADKLYYRKWLSGNVDNVNGATLSFYNMRWKVTAPPIFDPLTNTNPTGYVALNWATNGVAVTVVNNTDQTKDTTAITPSTFVTQSYRGYTKGNSSQQVITQEEAAIYPVSYLLPIGIDIINASDTLNNIGYGFKNL